MKVNTQSTVPVYTIAGASTARPLPEWLARKRRRSLKKDAEYANRVELLQDFEFEEASQCVRVSEDGDWLMSTGTYKPQIHTHYLPHLSLSYARHTNTVNEKFILLSSDYSKSLHLQTDRSLEFHHPGGLHYSTRVPRYGRDLVYSTRSAEALIPAVGVDSDGSGEVFRLNLELGRFTKSYAVDVGGDDAEASGTLQGGVHVGAVNCAAVADDSHGLMAFGTSKGTVEFWDSRSRNKICVLDTPKDIASTSYATDHSITALTFHSSGLQIATGSGAGLIRTYDLRSPVPLLQKDQGYDFPIKTLRYLTPSAASRGSVASEKLMSADKRIIKIFDANNGNLWTSVEPVVDMNHVEWVPDTGMLLTANEGRQQHSFFIPQLGSAPRWCRFLDNLVEEMAEDTEDPNAYRGGSLGNRGEVYDNYKFLDNKQLRDLNLDHLIGRTNLLRPYMHGFFVAQKLYEQAKLISNPDLFAQQRQKTIQEKIDKERESRIRGSKKVSVKVNKRLAETLIAKEEANSRRKAARALRKGVEEPVVDGELDEKQPVVSKRTALMEDDRFARLFQDEDFEIDETSHEFAMHNPSTVANHKGGQSESKTFRPSLTAAEQEDNGYDDESNDEDESSLDNAKVAARRQRGASPNTDDHRRIGTLEYKKAGHQSKALRMKVSSSTNQSIATKRRPQQTFGDLAHSRSVNRPNDRSQNMGKGRGGVVGEREVSFVPVKKSKGPRDVDIASEHDSSKTSRRNDKDRRNASGNVFRRM